MTHRPNGTQQERILKLLKAIQSGGHKVPEEYLRRHPSGDGVSARYIKQVMGITEANGRISELRGKGYEIETSKQKDVFGFAYHRLAPTTITMEAWFDELQDQPTPQV
jgi:biotin operon repressor